MKHRFFTLVLFLLISVAGFSQLSLRPQVGINFPSTNLSDVTHGDFKGNVGFQVGADLMIGGAFYVQPGLNFETTKLSIKDVGDLKMSRFNIPVMLGYKFGEKESKAFGFRIFVGPNFAFNVNKDVDDAFANFADNFKDFQISGVAGVGFDISIIFVDLGYRFGFSDFIKGDNIDGKTNAFLANAGIRIGF